jgi:hypothetical protein
MGVDRETWAPRTGPPQPKPKRRPKPKVKPQEEEVTDGD